MHRAVVEVGNLAAHWRHQGLTCSLGQPRDPQLPATAPSARFRQDSVQRRSAAFPPPSFSISEENLSQRPLAELFSATTGQDRFTYSCLISYF